MQISISLGFKRLYHSHRVCPSIAPFVELVSNLNEDCCWLSVYGSISGSVLLVEDPAVVARWERLIHSELNKNPQGGDNVSSTGSKRNLRYYSVASRQMVGVHVSIWTRASMYTTVKHVETVTVGCGVLGIFGNKVSVKRFED